MDSAALTDSTRSARSSAREVSEDSRSARAEASSGEVAAVVSERMRRYEVKRERADWSWLRTSLLFWGCRLPLWLVVLIVYGEELVGWEL